MGATVGRARTLAGRYDVLLATSGLWFVVQFLRYLFPPLFPRLQSEFGVGGTATGALFTALMLGYAAVQFPAGTLADRLGGPRVLLAGSAAFTAAACVAALAPSYAVVFVAAVLVGTTTGPHKTVAIPFLSRRYPDRTGTALGVMDTIGQFGGMTAPLVVASVLALALAWRVAFVVGAVVGLVSLAVFRARIDRDGEATTPGVRGETAESGNANGDEPGQGIAYRAAFADRRFVAFLVVTMLFSFSWNAVSAFLPLYLVAKELSPTTAGLVYGGFFAMSVSQAGTGRVGDRFGPFVPLVALIGVTILATGALVATTGTIALAGVVGLAGLGFHGFRPLRDAYLLALVPTSGEAGTIGIVRTLMLGAGALSPVAVGYVAETASYDVAFGLVAAVLVVAAGLTLLAR